MARLFQSSKFWLCIFATAIAAVPLVFLLLRHDVSADLKQNAITTFLYAVAAIWGLNVAATGVEDAAAKWTASPPAVTLIPPSTSLSPTSTKLPGLILAACLLCLLPGCQNPSQTVVLPDPMVQLAEAEDAYSIALQTIDAAARLHQIDHATAQRIIAIDKQIHDGFDQAHSLVGQPGFTQAVAEVKDLISKLKTEQAKLPPPVTQPSIPVLPLPGQV